MTYTLIMIFYIVQSAGVPLQQATLPGRYADEKGCTDAGNKAVYVNTSGAGDIRIGFVCVPNPKYK